MGVFGECVQGVLGFGVGEAVLLSKPPAIAKLKQPPMHLRAWPTPSSMRWLVGVTPPGMLRAGDTSSSRKTLPSIAVALHAHGGEAGGGVSMEHALQNAAQRQQCADMVVLRVGQGGVGGMH